MPERRLAPHQRAAATDGRVMPALLCTVRGCGLVLEPSESRFVCAHNHVFDRARSGYVNLLQPNDRRSRNPGDRPEAIAARRAFLDGGFEVPVVEWVARTIEKLRIPPRAETLDVGCGEGTYLVSLARRLGLRASGVDISSRAIALAARSRSDICWVVANADRRLPFQDGAFDLALTITARRNATELHRVLAAGALVAIVVPAADDLVELRTAILGERAGESRLPRLLAEFSVGFDHVLTSDFRTVVTLDAVAARAALDATYRGGRTSRSERATSLDAIDVTLARDLVVLRRVEAK